MIVDGPIVVFSLLCVLSLFLKDESFGESVKVITYCFYLGIAEWLHSLSVTKFSNCTLAWSTSYSELCASYMQGVA